jgi:hypothetical protein
MIQSNDGHYPMAVHRDRDGWGDWMIQVRYGSRRRRRPRRGPLSRGDGRGRPPGENARRRASADELPQWLRPCGTGVEEHDTAADGVVRGAGGAFETWNGG